MMTQNKHLSQKASYKTRGRSKRVPKKDDEFNSVIVDLARVTRVMAGGKRMRFRACVVVGDGKGRVGVGIKKGADVQMAVAKATRQAKKKLVVVPVVNDTIPHRMETSFRGARVLLKPASLGTGVIAGGAVRTVMQMAGVHNVVAKMKGSHNKINNVAATINAFMQMRPRQHRDNDRGQLSASASELAKPQEPVGSSATDGAVATNQ